MESRSHRQTRDRRRIRWWPAVALVLLAAAGLLWTWLPESAHRQTQITRSYTIVGSTLILLLVWLLLLSRLRWRVRGIAFVVIVVLGAAAASTLKVRGVSGDVLPILGWRWSKAPGQLPPPVPAAPATAAVATSSAWDYPQFLGPRRNGSLSGIGLARDWTAYPPRELWRQPIGAGWSSFAVAGDHAVTQEQRGGQEWVSCYEARTGRLIWTHANEARFDNPLGGTGPRATPTVHGDRVYALGATGILNALELTTGALIWSRDIVRDNGAEVPTYGVAASPLVIGPLVVAVAGGAEGRSLVAYDRESGELVWSGGDDPAGYGSPVLGELAGVPQIVLLTRRNVVAHAVTDGRLLWSWPWPRETEPTGQTLLLPDDRVFVSTGYGVGGKALRVSRAEDGGLEAALQWESTGLKAKFTNVVFRDGFLYGLDDGILACLDARTGERRWKGGRYGHGQVIGVDDLLLVQGESGVVVLVEARPEGFHELSRFQALDGKTWNHPTLVGHVLLVRNDREAACYELPLDG